ncbi:TerB family tellurite resistance protein [Oceanicola sp. S124]|uniref:TerB family tellurite resistance protein n=1 Tax=Oceanicola sp. S124 TaxID=1042378 RepID=UPI00025596F4|nr:TerB family tellurite resistance protein [Oceanicola sp. S124]
MITYGAIAVGFFMMLKGFMTNSAHRKKASEPTEAERRERVANGAIRVMLGVAAVDGKFAGNEKVIITALARDAYGYSIDEETMDKILAQFVADKAALPREARALGMLLDPDGARAVLKHAAMVACSDGELSLEEDDKLHQLALALNLSAETWTAQKKAAFAEIQRIVLEQRQAREAAQPAG